MRPLGTPAAGFRLPDTEGRVWTLEDLADAPVLVVAFIGNHCPFVKHILPTWAATSNDAPATHRITPEAATTVRRDGQPRIFLSR